MTPMRLSFSLLGLALTAACSTPAAIGEISGIEQFAQPCQNEPPVLTDADAEALAQQIPQAPERERAFWAPRDLQHRRTTACERARADGLLSAVARYNQAVRDSD